MSKNVEVRLSANTQQYQKAMRDAGSSTEAVSTSTSKTTGAVGDKWGKLGGSISSSMGLSYAAVGAAAVAAGAYAINAASNLTESINAVNVSYGDSAKAVHALGKDATESFGLSTRAFNDAAVSFTNFAEDVAGDGGDVAGTLHDLMLRSTDFASVMNIDVGAAGNAFKSALSGEAEPLKAFGINISDAAVKAYALQTGLISVGGTMTDQQKVQARYGLLMKETAKTAGDFANTGDGYANSMKKARAEVENLAASLGKVLLPALTDGLGTITDVISAWQTLANSPAVQLGFEIRMPGGGGDSVFGFLAKSAERAINPIEQVRFMIEGGTKAIKDATGASDKAAASQSVYGASVDAVSDSINAAIAEHQSLNSQLGVATDSYTQVTASIDAAIAAMAAQTAAADTARTANMALADGTYSLHDAEDKMAESVDKANKVFADSNSTLREMRTAADDVAISTDAFVTAQLELDGTTRDSVRGQQLWNDGMMANAATLSGPMQTEVLAHIGRVNGIPTEKMTLILADADPDNLAQVQAELNALSAARTMPLTFSYKIPADLQRILNAGGDVQLRTGRSARGTNNWRGGLTWVGEEGPELMNLPQGTQIFPHDKSVAMMAGGTANASLQRVGAAGSSFPKELTFMIEGNPYRAILADHDRAMVSELLAGVR